MTAICGIYYFDKTRHVYKRDLEKMLETMKHRGLLGAKFFVHGNIGLSCRYSQLQYSHEFEAMGNPASEISSVIDGLIFNYDSLAHSAEIDYQGFASYKSSQLIACLYKKEDISFLDRLDGMFSWAIWDGERSRLVLARDRFGTKPLYYFEYNAGVIFASEIKAILRVLKEKPNVNLSALQEYLTFRYIAGSSTLFEGIKELQPGHYIFWSGNKKIEKIYWSVVEDVQEEDKSQNLHYHQDCIENLLKRAIKKRMGFSNKVGANCSGGIDSGLVTAFSSFMMEEPLSTYSVGFEEKGWDERYFAALTAKKYHTDHHELLAKSDVFANQLPRLNWYNDEPISDPNSVFVFLLAKYSSEIVDLLLTGEGADEVFLGYPRYNLLNVYSLTLSLPNPLRSTLICLMQLVDNRRVNKLKSTLCLNPLDAIIYNSAFVPQTTIKDVLDPDLQCPEFSFRKEILRNIEGKDLLIKTMIYEIQTYLVSSLNRLDKMNMAVGLETATPFLDNDLFEYALRIPKNLKIKLFSNKYILRKLGLKYLPLENLKMPKSGFGVPISEWFKADRVLKNFLEEVKSNSFMSEFFDKKKLNQLINQHVKAEYDHSEIIWLITNFYLWHQQFYQ